MEKLERIAVLESGVQARLIGSILTERNIPHLLQSYHDSAYDGLWQGMKGWGHIEAPADYRKEILGIIEEIRQQSDDATPSDPPSN